MISKIIIVIGMCMLISSCESCDCPAPDDRYSEFISVCKNMSLEAACTMDYCVYPQEGGCVVKVPGIQEISMEQYREIMNR